MGDILINIDLPSNFIVFDALILTVIFVIQFFNQFFESPISILKYAYSAFYAFSYFRTG